ncbi:MAG: PQQ-binding-like beta-propeller repeat protein [Actinomycetota bacterium]
MPSGRHAVRSRIPFPALLAVLVVLLIVAVVVQANLGDAEGGGGSAAGPSSDGGSGSVTPSAPASGGTTPSQTPSGTPTPGPINTAFPGITTFRGNATRTYYGEGPVPRDPVIRWTYPASGGMCSTSSDQHGARTWCGTGWTGQPNVIVHDDGRWEMREGAYDGAYHFLNARLGRPMRPALQTGDLAKGSATTDPDGYPLYYGGSRDDLFRIIALDRPEPKVLYTIDADTTVPRPLWNNDWDGAALVIGDYLLEGGENGWLYVVRLNRDYDADGLVTVDPRIVATIAGFDERLLSDIGDDDVSIENSVSFSDGVVYFANSGGLVQGWDVSDLLGGGSRYERVFRFWTGDDTDASVVIDEDGYLYVASEYQRFNQRSRDVGQLMKLDPSEPDDPLVWSIPATEIGFEGAGGSWSTPALYGDLVYFTTAAGRVLAVDRDSGRIVWELGIGAPAIASPVVVDDVLIQGDCTGSLYAWDVSKPRFEPPLLWKMTFPGCVESTPAVWHGWLLFGTRAGAVYGVSDPAR